MSNPYAPPQAAVRDIADPDAGSELAERGTRLAASILDAFVFGVMAYLPFVIGLPIVAAGANSNAAIAIAAALCSVGFIVWAWITLTCMKQNGQSIAKKWLHIKVVRSDGSPVTLARLIWLRNVVNWILSVIPLYGAVDALFIFGEARRCLHDKLADTVVVKA
jgi:uncharacterized RDD family membrane protein YckC